MMASGHHSAFISTFPFKQKMLHEPHTPIGDITIGNDVWIGDSVILLGNCRIGDGVVVGAQSLVISGQVLEDFGVYVGSPGCF